MNNFCFQLSTTLDSALVPGIREKLCEPDTNTFIPIEDSTVFNQEWVAEMRSIGLPFTGAGIVPYTVDQKRLVHTDASVDPNKLPLVAFNAWLHSPNNTQMVWYKWPAAEPIKHLTRPTIWYWNDEVEHNEVYRHSLSYQNLYAVRIDVPHTALPLGERFVAISFRTPIEYYTNWDQLITKLAPHIIN